MRGAREPRRACARSLRRRGPRPPRLPGASGRSCSSTRSTASTRRSKTPSCRTSSTGRSRPHRGDDREPELRGEAAALLSLVQGVPPRRAGPGRHRGAPPAGARRSRSRARRPRNLGRRRRPRGDRRHVRGGRATRPRGAGVGRRLAGGQGIDPPPRRRRREGRREPPAPALRQGRRGALQRRQRLHQIVARERPRRGGVLDDAHARGGRRPSLRLPPNAHLRERGRGQRRPSGRSRWPRRPTRPCGGSGCPRVSTPWPSCAPSWPRPRSRTPAPWRGSERASSSRSTARWASP